MLALVSECGGTAAGTSAVGCVVVADVAAIGSPSGAFACSTGVAGEPNWTLLMRFLAGTASSLTEPASSTLKNGLIQMQHYLV